MTVPQAVPQARRWLKAVRKLEAYYRGENDDYLHFCPLCVVAYGACHKCPWVIFSKIKDDGENDPCNRYTEVHFDSSPLELRRTRPPRWVRLSLTRLARWEKRLIKIVGEKP